MFDSHKQECKTPFRAVKNPFRSVDIKPKIQTGTTGSSGATQRSWASTQYLLGRVGARRRAKDA
eukprot:2198114-Prorocentrum_lima.AAC.1